MKTLPTLLFLTLTTVTLSSQTANAEDKSRFGLGGKIQFSNWEGDNTGANNSSYDSDATMASIAFRYQYGKLFAGASLQGGEYNFNGTAPDQNDTTTSKVQSNVKIDRGELDLIVGYYFWPRVSFFLDLKHVTNKWVDQDYEARYSGLGLGVSTFAPLPNNWTFYASFGIVPLKVKDKNDDNIGDGSGSSLELGANYRITDQHSINIGLKAQNHEYDFDNNNKQTHKVGGLVVGYNYTFR